MNRPTTKHCFSSQRPPPSARTFSSQAVEHAIEEVSAQIADPELAWMFSNCLPNTLDTTIKFSRDAQGRPDTFVITGDIYAMWLRDSTNQVWPYLEFAKEDPALRDLLAGVVRRQTACVLLDPYANAFYAEPNPPGEGTGDIGLWKNDRTEMRPGVHERKYELDSLCSVLQLAHGYWKATGDTSCFDEAWLNAVRSIIATVKTEQAGTNETPGSPYVFQRTSEFPTESLAMGGHGQPRRRCGLVRSAFNACDDSSPLPFLVPSNVMLAAMLRNIVALLRALGQDELAAETESLADEINRAILRHAVVRHETRGEIYAYAVNGYGSHYLMDDPGLPSLLSLPYFGCCAKNDPLYLRTRAYALSSDNPFFIAGSRAEGICSPHPHLGIGQIWPMEIIMRAMTSESEDEIMGCLRTLKDTHAGTGFMHESFWMDDPSRFTRSWFAWANSLFGEFILTLSRERPHLLKRTFTPTTNCSPMRSGNNLR